MPRIYPQPLMAGIWQFGPRAPQRRCGRDVRPPGRLHVAFQNQSAFRGTRSRRSLRALAGDAARSPGNCPATHRSPVATVCEKHSAREGPGRPISRIATSSSAPVGPPRTINRSTSTKRAAPPTIGNPAGNRRRWIGCSPVGVSGIGEEILHWMTFPAKRFSTCSVTGRSPCHIVK